MAADRFGMILTTIFLIMLPRNANMDEELEGHPEAVCRAEYFDEPAEGPGVVGEEDEGERCGLRDKSPERSSRSCSEAVTDVSTQEGEATLAQLIETLIDFFLIGLKKLNSSCFIGVLTHLLVQR